MIGKTQNSPGKQAGLLLTKKERDLLLTGMVYIPERVEQAIRETPANKRVMISLVDLDRLVGHVAGEANHAKDPKVAKVLDGVFWKIENLLMGYQV